jgi:hypothetical protein
MRNWTQDNQWAINKKVNLITKTSTTGFGPDSPGWDAQVFRDDEPSIGNNTGCFGYTINQITAFPGIDPSDGKQKIYMSFDYNISFWSQYDSGSWNQIGGADVKKVGWFDYAQVGSGTSSCLEIKQTFPEDGSWLSLNSSSIGNSGGKFTFNIMFYANSLRVNVDWQGAWFYDQSYGGGGSGNVDAYNSNY